MASDILIYSHVTKSLWSEKRLIIFAYQDDPSHSMSGSRGGGGGVVRGPDPLLENYENTGFLSNTGPDPLKITKLPIQHSMLGHHRPTSKTPFKWRFAGGPLIARL